MRDLQLVGVTDPAGHLVVAGDDGQEFRIPVDARLEAVVRAEQQRTGQLTIELASQPRPAEIQARIRAGASAEEVAAAAGLPLERVRRYEGPVLAEREFMVRAARGTALRRGQDTPAPLLGDVVEERLEALGAAVLGWDSRRREDGRWVVGVSYRVDGSTAAAEWVYDPVGRTVIPEATAAELLDPTPVPAPEDVAGPGRVRRLSSVPSAADTADPFNLVVPPAAPEVLGPHEVPAADAEPESAAEEPPPVPRRAAAGRGRRASVPAWDDIVFGARKTD